MPELKLGMHETDGETAARKEMRSAYFSEADGYLPTQVLTRTPFGPAPPFPDPRLSKSGNRRSSSERAGAPRSMIG
jgi:hypothetical protein